MIGRNKTISQLALASLFIAYWLFVWKLERVDFATNPPLILTNAAENFPLFGILISRLTFVFEIFSPRVLRHFIPLIVGWWLAREALVRFLISFYDLPNRESSTAQLTRSSHNTQRRSRPLNIRQDNLEILKSSEPMVRIGGPGPITINPGDALVTERNGRFLRVIGSGSQTLGRFEIPVAVVDVRPQERTADKIKITTRDGIEISTSLNVSFQVSTGNELPSREQPFPFNYQAVRNVAYSDTNCADGIKRWDTVPLTVAADQLKALVAEYDLDRFVYSERSTVHFHELIAREMERRARDILARFGVQLISARLGMLKLPEKVTEEHIEYWRSGWDTQRRMQEAEGEAWALQEEELARAQAGALMIEAYMEGIEGARRSGFSVNARDVVALRLIEVLETMALQSQHLANIPDGLMLILGNLRKQLILNQGGMGASGKRTIYPQD